MKRLITVLLVIGVAVPAYGQTQQTLLDMFRIRIGERDSTTSVIPDTSIKALINMAQDKQVKAMGYLPKVENILYHPDSNSYALDGSYKYETGVIVRTSDMWEAVVKNPGFLSETDRFSYDIRFHSSEQARLYIQGRDLYEDDTVRIFYAGTTPWLGGLADSCLVAGDDQVRIIDEALVMFEAAMRSWVAQKLQWDQLRFDMGALKPPEDGQ